MKPELLSQLANELFAAVPKPKREQMVKAAVAALVEAPRPRKGTGPSPSALERLIEEALRDVVFKLVADILAEDAGTMDLLRERAREVVGRAIEDGRVDASFRRIAGGALATLRRG